MITNRPDDDHADFCECTTSARDGFRVSISCKLGLWSVEGSDPIAVINEAAHYFSQYKSDGEYHEIIGGPTPMEVLQGVDKPKKMC